MAHKRQAYTFDRVLGPDNGQEDVYNVAQPFVNRFLDGFNVTVLAYGQTSSGKSYTMGTSAADVDFESLVAGRRPDPQVGIIPRAVADIFTHLRQTQSKKNGVRFTAKSSFVEIYNEELIDLLADTETDNRPLVQIREDKQGHIFWSGLREPRVNSVTDVMNLLLQGSSIRRTNETDMNAQSSRSHAIFSLTLTQQKFVGSGPPPPPSAAHNTGIGGPGGRSTPSGGRSTPSTARSGLPRPSSFLPQPSRSVTPSSMQRTSMSALRPTSTMGVSSSNGQRSASPMLVNSTSETTQDGDWITVTSKFHFVDLAGSERLKRTAAQGERAKEGISINAGLHALGNVISALGDPAKAKRTTHIPYRDSKLTRLLQDSLGGNACTLMIACVAPTEYNVGETINTLQYANRARNIKNKAERNEVEQGWDDVEHLQQTVKKLRTQIAALRASKGVTVGDAGALQELNAEILQWQGKYTTSSQMVSQLTAELTKLQHAVKASNRGTTADGNEDFLAAAEPIIVEYEKTVDAMESEINLLKAAGSYHEDLINEQEERITQQEERITQAEQQLESRESTIVELQARLAKLQDRESTAEGYARDIEAQLAALTTKGETSAEASAELRKDVIRLKEEAGSRETYIKDLESRLTKADSNVAALTSQVARLEMDIQRRDQSFAELQDRVAQLDNGEQTKALAEDYRRSEQSNLELRAELDALQTEKTTLVQERGQLNEAAAQHQLHRGTLEDKIRALEASVAAAAAAAAVAGATVHKRQASSETIENQDESQRDAELAPSSKTSEAAAAVAELGHLHREIESLRQDLETARRDETQANERTKEIDAKYQQTLTEMHALNLQLSEAKLMGNANVTPKLRQRALSNPGTEPEEELEIMAPTTEPEGRLGRPSLSRRSSSHFTPLRLATSSTGASGDRAASSTDDRIIKRRSSGSFFGYNPQQGGLDSPSRRERPRSLSQSLSLSQELSPALSGGHRTLSLSGTVVPPSPSSVTATQTPSPLQAGGLNGGRMSDTRSASLTAQNDRKMAMLEKGVMSLQEALKKRDAEIAELENALRSQQQQAAHQPINHTPAGLPILSTTLAPSVSSEDEQGSREESSSELISPSASASQLSVYDTPSPGTPAALETGQVPLTPVSEREFTTIKQLLADSQAANGGDVSGDNMDRLDALIRSMARKEEVHRERSDTLSSQLRAEQSKRAELERSAESEATTLRAEIERLRAALLEADTATRDADVTRTPRASARPSADENLVTEELDKLQTELLAAQTQLTDRERQFEEQLQAIRDEQADALSKNGSQAAEEHAQKDRLHSEALARLVAEHQAAMEQTLLSQQSKLNAVIADHATALETRDQGNRDVLAKAESAASQAAADHATAFETLRADHQIELQRLSTEHQVELQKLNTEHQYALSSLGADKDAAHQDVVRSYEDKIQDLVQQHMDELVQTRDEHESSLTKHQEEAAVALAAATAGAGAAAIVSNGHGDDAHAKALEALQNRADSDRQQALADAHTAYSNERQRMLDEHEGRIADLKREHSQQIDQLSKRLSTFRDVGGEIVDVGALRLELSETSDALVTLEDALTSVTSERDELADEVTHLRSAGSAGSNANEVAALRREIDSQKITLLNLKTELQRSKGEILLLNEERARQEHTLRELHDKTPSRGHRESNGGARSPTSPSYEDGPLSLNGSLRGMKQPPPPTPPPSMPVPPTPSGSSIGHAQRTSTVGARTSLSSLMTRSDSPGPGMTSTTGGTLTRSSSATSMHTQSPSINSLTNQDAKKLLAEQSEELKNLAKQLSHCEADLQANIDLVATLEAALNDSERNLRKSRVQLGEITRERDRYATQSDDLRQQVVAAQQEADTVRNSVLLEKQGFEQKIREERLAKEKAARDLEIQLEEINRKKTNKLFCM